MREAAVSVGSAIVVEYAGNRIVLEGRVREIVRLLMRDGERVEGRLGEILLCLLCHAPEMHLDDAKQLVVDLGGPYVNCHVSHRLTFTAAPAETVSWRDTRDG